MKDYLKRKTLGLFVKTNGALSRVVLNHLGVIFCFHRVMQMREEGELFGGSRLSNTLEQVDQCVRFFRQKGYAFLSMDEVVDQLDKPAASKKFVAFTFDDGYRDNHTTVLPFMEAEGVPFMVYVTTGLIENQLSLWWYEAEEIINSNTQLLLPQQTYSCNTMAEKLTVFNDVRTWLIASHTKEELQQKLELLRAQQTPAKPVFNRDTMSWDEVRAIGNSKTGAIGAHTVNHLALSRLSVNDLRSEMVNSKKILEEKIGQPVHHFAYPYGTVAESHTREYAMAHEVGFKSAVTLRAGAVFARARQQPMALPRVYISHHSVQQRLEEIENGIFHFHHNGFTKLISG